MDDRKRYFLHASKRLGFGTFPVHFMCNGSIEVRFSTFLNFASCQETAILRLHYHIASKWHLWHLTISNNYCSYKFLIIHVPRTLSSTAPTLLILTITARAQMSPTPVHGRHHTVLLLERLQKGLRCSRSPLESLFVFLNYLGLLILTIMLDILIDKGTNANDDTKFYYFRQSGYESTIIPYRRRPNPTHIYWWISPLKWLYECNNLIFVISK